MGTQCDSPPEATIATFLSASHDSMDFRNNSPNWKQRSIVGSGGAAVFTAIGTTGICNSVFKNKPLGYGHDQLSFSWKKQRQSYVSNLYLKLVSLNPFLPVDFN